MADNDESPVFRGLVAILATVWLGVEIVAWQYLDSLTLPGYMGLIILENLIARGVALVGIGCMVIGAWFWVVDDPTTRQQVLMRMFLWSGLFIITGATTIDAILE